MWKLGNHYELTYLKGIPVSKQGRQRRSSAEPWHEPNAPLVLNSQHVCDLWSFTFLFLGLFLLLKFFLFLLY